MKNRGNRGFTFIEVILAIVLLAIIMPGLLYVFVNTTVTASNADALPIATTLGNDLMEDIKSRKFDELDSKSASGNWSAPLGADTGEITTDKTTFDDVDDFNGWTQNFGSDFPGYNASVTVSYVASNNLNTSLTIPSPLPNSWTPSYKRLEITISNGAALPSTIELATVVSEMQSF